MPFGGFYSESLVDLHGGRPRPLIVPHRLDEGAGVVTGGLGNGERLARPLASAEGRRPLLERLHEIAFEDPVAQKAPLAMLAIASLLPAVLLGYEFTSCGGVDGLVAVVGSAAVVLYAALLVTIDFCYRMRHEVGCPTDSVACWEGTNSRAVSPSFPASDLLRSFSGLCLIISPYALIALGSAFP